MPSRSRSRANRAAWSFLLGFAAASAMLPNATIAAGPLDPLATPVASILASIVPVPVPTPLPTLPLQTQLPTLPVTTPTLPIVTPTLPIVSPTLPIVSPTLPIVTPTLPTLPVSPGPSQEASPSSTPMPPGQAGGPSAGVGGVGDPFIPQGGVSSLVGPRNGVLGALPEMAVPALIVGLPVILLVLFLLAQGATAALWLPLVRRFMGGFGPLRKR